MQRAGLRPDVESFRKPVLEQPIVFFGSEGEVGVVAPPSGVVAPSSGALTRARSPVIAGRFASVVPARLPVCAAERRSSGAGC